MHDNVIQQLYIAYYGRPADPGGLAYWSDRLNTNGGDLSTIMDAFGSSEEYEERFGALNDQALVNNLYYQIFGRAAEPEGLAFYTGMLARGDSSLIELAVDIVNGTQGTDLVVIDKRTELAQQFTAQISERNLVYADEEAAMVVQLLSQVEVDTDVEAFGQTELQAMLDLLPSADVVEGEAAPTLATDAQGNATAGGNLSAHDLSSVSGVLTLDNPTVLPNATSRLPAAIELGSHWLVLKGTLDISDVALSSPSGLIPVNIFGEADITMTSVQHQQMDFGQVGRPGAWQHIRFSDDEAQEKISAHHYVEFYHLSDTGQTIVVGEQSDIGIELTGGDGDDTFISLMDDGSRYLPGDGDDTLDFTGSSGRSLVSVSPGEGDDILLGFVTSGTVDAGGSADRVGIVGTGSADEAAARIAEILLIDNGQVDQANLAGSTSASLPVDLQLIFAEGGSLTFVDVLEGLSALNGVEGALRAGDTVTVEGVTGADLEALVSAAHLQLEYLA